jgi:3D (Asp-Asp-Asp) domain-containing protein
MRNRIVDLALIAALVAVAGGIMWTLFNLGGTQRAPSPPPAASPTEPAAPDVQPTGPQALPSPPTGAGVVPVDPDEADTPPGAVLPLSPEAPATPGTPSPADADAPAPAEPAAAEPAAADPAAVDPAAVDPAAVTPTEPLPPGAGTTVPAADAAPVPSGTVDLERVGFSYVTGGAGACGIVLEPWQHVAVSRELLDAYGCGAQVTVTFAEPVDGRDSFTAVVADTMNPQFSRTANVYVGTDEDAFAYGLTAGSITPAE